MKLTNLPRNWRDLKPRENGTTRRTQGQTQDELPRFGPLVLATRGRAHSGSTKFKTDMILATNVTAFWPGIPSSHSHT